MKNGILFFVLFFFISCSVKNEIEKDVSVLSLSVKQVVEYIPLSKVTSSAILVTLQTNDDILIKEIRDIEKNGGYYFISDGQTLYK